MKPYVPFALLMLAAAPVCAQPVTTLSGAWEADFTVGDGMQSETVVIRQIGSTIEARKLTGDDYVPAGTISLRGAVGANPFAAEQICAARGFADPQWQKVTVTILDPDHLKLEGGCSGGAIWRRLDGAGMA